MKKFTKKENYRRYRLHRKVRDAGHRLNVRKHTIYTDYNQIAYGKYVLELVNRFKYVIQTEIR